MSASGLPSTSPFSEVDRVFMARAIDLSRRGFPAPNPHVGCVIVKDGAIVGEGYHRLAGQAHAEVEALAVAGEDARGATAYVTLEPCNHHGRTPPCTGALITAGVARVVYAVDDPNPRAGGGGGRLRDAGLDVVGGLLAGAAASVNERFLTAMRQRRPFVTVKAGISLDGRIALPSGESKWITSEEARECARRLRADMGAVLVGPGTVLADDPSLTYSSLPVVRVILDPRREIPGAARVFDEAAPTLHVVPSTSAEAMGSVMELPLVQGRFPVPALLEKLFELGHTGLLVEGGGRTIGSFFAAGCVDAIELFLAPKVLGGGRSWVEGLNLPTLADAPEFRISRLEALGDDLWISLRPHTGETPE